MEHSAPQDLTTILDAVDAFAETATADETWQKAVDLTQALGFNALNVVELSTQTGAPLWVRSSMNTQWLEDYFAQDFFRVDAVVNLGLQGRRHVRMQGGQVAGHHCDDKLALDLGDQMVSWGYHTSDFLVQPSNNGSTLKGVTLTQDRTTAELPRHFKLLASLLMGVVSPPVCTQSPGATTLINGGLTVRERDVLSYLASGLRNDAIAHRLSIAEVTVRTHIASARAKLGAATREEAIVLALRKGLLHL